MDKIKLVEASQLKNDVPDFKSGDTVSVHVKVKEGDKERIQEYQGMVISRHGAGLNATFTVRKISDGVGVERIFPLHSPRIAKIEKVKEGKVRRAKLYYVRDLTAKGRCTKNKRLMKSRFAVPDLLSVSPLLFGLETADSPIRACLRFTGRKFRKIQQALRRNSGRFFISHRLRPAWGGILYRPRYRRFLGVSLRSSAVSLKKESAQHRTYSNRYSLYIGSFSG